jgi:outer membrane protein OmpA-like peptidoglycan-associated protein
MAIDRRDFAIRLGFGVFLGGLMMLAGAAPLAAAEQPTTADILKSLAPPEQAPLKRSLFGAPAATTSPLSAEESRLMDTARKRSITIEERKELASITTVKRAIDLEVNFDYNSAVIRPDAARVLASLGAALTDPALKGSTILVGGHTDARGSDAYNRDLSERRAHAVRAFLIETYKVAPEALVAVGFGEEQLRNRADPYAGENRRVQVVNMSAAK